MDGETGFPVESFELSVFGFHGAEMGGERGGRVAKETECDLRGASEFRMSESPLLYSVTRSLGLEVGTGVKVVMQEERESKLMFLILRYVMTRGGLEIESWSEMLNETRKWSVMWIMSVVQLEGVRPEKQIKSIVCPLM